MLKLSELAKKLPEIELPNGRVVRPRAPDGQCMDLYLKATKAPVGAETVALLYEIVERVLPDVPREEILALDLNQCMAVVALANGTYDAVNKHVEREAGISEPVAAEG